MRTAKSPERRYDHIYATKDFEVIACRYHVGWLDAQLSDHGRIFEDAVVPQAVDQGGRALFIVIFMRNQMIDSQYTQVGRGQTAPGLGNVGD